MANMRIEAGLTQTGDQVLIELLMERSPLGHITLDAAGTESFMLALAKARSQLPDQRVPTIAPTAQLEGIRDPAWQLRGATHLGPVLVLRHPGFGWLAFEFPPSEARALGQSLIDLATLSEPKGGVQ